MLCAFGGRGDEYLGAGDQLVTTRVVFAEPDLVVAEPVQCDSSFEVVFQCDRGGLADRMERRDEDPEVQRTGHLLLQSGQEAQQQFIDLGGPLLLEPVPGSVDHHLAVVAGDDLTDAVTRV